MSKLFSLKGKVTLITGASSGIGAATAKLFAELGSKLAITGRVGANLTAVGDECRKFGAEVLEIQADLTKEADVTRIYDETMAHFKRLDCLVNNAGIGGAGSIESTSLEQYDTIMNVNMRAPYQLTMLAVPQLLETKGCVVNVSSVNGIRSFPNVLAYNVSKAALDQFTKCVALELASRGVRVNSVNPGVVVTNLHKRVGMDDVAYASFLERSKTTHAIGRVGEADEIAQSIAFLASDMSSNTTGLLLSSDGGRHAMCPR